jgi:hypothetical protein
VIYDVSPIDIPASCEIRAVIRETLEKLRRATQNKRRGVLTSGVVLLHDSARLLTAAHWWSLSTGRCLTTLLTALISL